MEISIDDAIRIANIISKAPAERLSLIKEVFAQAGIEIGEIEILARPGSYREINGVDLEITLAKLTEGAEQYNGFYMIKPTEFNSMCVSVGLSPIKVRRALAKMDILKAGGDGKYSCVVRVHEKPERRVCIYEDWQDRLEKAVDTEQ